MVFAQWTSETLAETLDGLRTASRLSDPVSVVVIVPAGAVTSMQRARAAGAADVLFSPPDPEEIRAEIEDGTGPVSGVDLANQEVFRAMRRDELIGECTNFRRSLDELRLAARCDANVLLVGETGTGKEIFAQSIHKLGRRSGSPNIAVNCASLPSGLLEVELFGHAKGAFTGADTARAGRFEVAGVGTLLLDEIGDMEPALQMKLLRVIEQRVFQRVGENEDRKFQARLVCATSVDLEDAVNQGKFRPDLLGRINQFKITLPPLRDRQADIAILARHFLRKHSKGRRVEISRTAMEVLEGFDFPMNVRQLQNAIVGALARSDPGHLILVKHLPADITAPRASANSRPQMAILLPQGLDYKVARERAVRAVDSVYLSELLRKHGGNQTRAAEEAGVDRKTFSSRLEEAHLDEERESHG